MAYNKLNMLQKVLEIQAIVLKEKKRGGVSQKWIYENLIKDRFYISYPTFNKYLAMNAKREMNKLKT